MLKSYCKETSKNKYFSNKERLFEFKMKYTTQHIGEIIKKERTIRGWSQDDLMAEMKDRGNGIGRNTLSDLENGKIKDIKLSHILLLCEIFDCDIDYFFDEITCKTRDTQFICDETGLSEPTVLILNLIKDAETKCFIDGLIQHNNGLTVENLALLPILIKEKNRTLSSVPKLSVERVDIDTEINGYKYECLFGLVSFIEEFYGVNILSKGKTKEG